MANKPLALFYINFFFMKSIVFTAPLIFLLDGGKFYTLIEKEIAKSLMFLPFFAFGTCSAYSHFTINKKTKSAVRHLFQHTILISCFFLIAGTLFYITNNEILVFFFSVIFLISRALSQYCKTHGLIFPAVFFDTFFYIILFLVGIFFFFSSLVALDTLFFLVSVIYLSFFFCMRFRFEDFFYNFSLDRNSNYSGHIERVKFYSFGFKGVIVSSLIAIFITAPRAFSDTFLNPEAESSFFLLMRGSMVVILFYQLLYLKNFREVISLNPEKIFSFSIIIYAACFIFSIFLSALISFLFLETSILVWVFVASITATWAITSFLEFYYVRDNKIKAFLIITSIIISIFFLIYLTDLLNYITISVLFFLFSIFLIYGVWQGRAKPPSNGTTLLAMFVKEDSRDSLKS